MEPSLVLELLIAGASPLGLWVECGVCDWSSGDEGRGGGGGDEGCGEVAPGHSLQHCLISAENDGGREEFSIIIIIINSNIFNQKPITRMVCYTLQWGLWQAHLLAFLPLYLWVNTRNNCPYPKTNLIENWKERENHNTKWWITLSPPSRVPALISTIVHVSSSNPCDKHTWPLAIHVCTNGTKAWWSQAGN